MSNLDLFMTFFKADRRCIISDKDELKKRNIPGSELDFPLFRYVHSLNNRIAMLWILHQNILEQNIKAVQNFEELYQKDIGFNIPGITLVLSFESFINQIYNIFENIAKINLFLFDESNEQPPQKFSKQLEKIVNNAFSFSPCYDEEIRKMAQWYPEAVSIRHNSNHFMVGFDVYSKNNTDEWYPQYMNFNIVDRENPIPIEIKWDIIGKTREYYDLTMKSLDQISKCYIERIDKDTPCAVSFITEKGIEIRKISFNQFLSGNYGEVIFPYKND